MPPNESIRYAKDPSILSAKVEAVDKERWIIIDEVQKVPSLLDEVHHLIENRGYKKFILSGSSARKLKRGGANLLAGRAVTRNLYPFTSEEVSYEFSPSQIITYGALPLSYTLATDQQRKEFLLSYLMTYINEEIKAEGHVRNIGDFSRFLDIAALSAGQRPNISGLSRDAGVGRDTVQGYFGVLEDTLLGSWLPAYRPRAKVKEVASPKFYWFDPGVLNAAAGGFEQPLPSDWNGILLGHWVHSEIKSYIDYNNVAGSLGYWATPSKSEVDFVFWYGEKMVGIEVKHSSAFKKDHLKGLRSLKESINLLGSYVVYLGKEELKVDDCWILPVKTFLKRLHSGEIFSTVL